MSKKTPRAVIYCRISTAGQEQGTSLAAQFVACQQKAQAIEANVIASLEDVQSGGDYLSRTRLQEALKLLEAGEADTLIIYDMSRYSRDQEHQQAIRKRVEAAGARIVFCTLDLPDNAEGNLMFGISGTFAQYEREKIRERTMNGHKRRVDEGVMPIRARSPFGYYLITRDDVVAGKYPPGREGRYEPVPEQLQWVPRLFEIYARSSLGDATRFLIENGVPGARGGKWVPSTVRNILRNPIYKGKPAYGKVTSRKDERRLGEGFAANYTRPAAREDWRYLKDSGVEAVVSEELFERVQERLATSRANFSGRNDRKALLTGIARCPKCGGRLQSQALHSTRMRGGVRSSVNVPGYLCNKARSGRIRGPATCPYKHYAAAPLEAVVIKAVRSVAQQPEKLDVAYRAHVKKRAKKSDTTEAERLGRQIVALQRREKAIAESKVEAKLSGAQTAIFDEMLKSATTERIALEARQRQLQPVEDEAQSPQSRAAFTAELMQDVDAMLSAPPDEMPTHEKGRLLALLVSVVYPTESGARILLQPSLGQTSDGGQCELLVEDDKVTVRWSQPEGK